jgi:glycosyltransferase involved in cell wall biosynthesis
MTELSVILPVYNQADIISPVFDGIYRTISSLKTGFEIILVENGSTDNTRDATVKLAKKYRNTKAISTSKGYGSAVIAGLEVSRGKYICYMPSDGQADLKVIPELFQLAKTGRYEIVKVRRINRESALRVITSGFLSLILKLFFGTPLIDINGSPRVLRRDKILSLKLHYRDSFIDSEMAIKAARTGWKIKEIPAVNPPRFGGVSSRSWRTYTEFIRNVLTYKP